MRSNERNKVATATRVTKNVGTTKKNTPKKNAVSEVKTEAPKTAEVKTVAPKTVEVQAKSSTKAKTVAKTQSKVAPKEVVANIVDISKINLQEALGGAETKMLHGVSKKSVEAYPVYTVLINLGPVKVVKVRYTENNWKTIKEGDLAYEKAVENDLELWGTSIKLESKSTEKFQYAVSYEVNGITYWDNNIGENHKF